MLVSKMHVPSFTFCVGVDAVITHQADVQVSLQS